MRWTEGYIAASERPWRRGPCRGRSAWHACGWVSREPGRPHRLHLKGCRGAGTGSPRPRPWTSHLASDGANRRCSDGTAGRRQRSAGGWTARSRSVSEYRRSGGIEPTRPRGGKGAPLEGKTANTPRLETVSTKRQRIAELARQAPELVFTSLAHHIDIDMLHAAHVATRKDGAVGLDGQTADDYAANLEANLQSLLDRFKSGRYHAPPVRRVHIPKGDGRKTRPIGIPTFEDKVLQRAVVMVLESVYEQDFLDASCGFRPGRSAHGALQTCTRRGTARASRCGDSERCEQGP